MQASSITLFIAASCGLANLAESQWSTDVKTDLEGEPSIWDDLTNFTETIDLDQDKTIQNGTGKNNCF